MDATTLRASLLTVLDELVDGPRNDNAFMLNGGDAGLLRSLSELSAADASTSSNGGATVAAHVDHLGYGLSLLNRWAAGEQPFASADWEASWRRGPVTEAEWRELLDELHEETRRWRGVLDARPDFDEGSLDVIVASIAHLAYHMGAIRQIARGARGPKQSVGSR